MKKVAASKRKAVAKASPGNLQALISDVRGLIESARRAAAGAINTLQVLTKGALGGSAALKQIGDVAAATNQSIEDTAFWVGKLFNFLQNDRPVANLLFRLTDVGIVSAELANELERLEAQGAGFGQKWAAVTKELERAKGGMDEEAKSLGGLRQQLLNVGGAQEDSDCILAPEWQAIFESKAAEMLRRL